MTNSEPLYNARQEAALDYWANYKQCGRKADPTRSSNPCPRFPTTLEMRRMPETQRAYYVGFDGCYLAEPVYGHTQMVDMMDMYVEQAKADNVNTDDIVTLRADQMDRYESVHDLTFGHRLPNSNQFYCRDK